MMDQAEAGALVQAKLTELGPEFAAAMELPRLWVTGMQPFVRPDVSMLVFREQNLMIDDAGHAIASVKNVASFAIPTETLREFAKVLAQVFDTLDVQQVESAQ